MKKLLTEGGIRNINELSKRYKKAKIYFHMDLDGVTTALAMKKYLEDNGIKVVESEIIQYQIESSSDEEAEKLSSDKELIVYNDNPEKKDYFILN